MANGKSKIMKKYAQAGRGREGAALINKNPKDGPTINRFNKGTVSKGTGRLGKGKGK